MENKKSVIPIAISVFCIIMLLANGNIEKVSALQVSDKSITTPETVVSTAFSGNSYFVAPSFATDDISVYNAADGSLFKVIDTTSAMEKGDWIGNIRAIDCSGSICYFEFDTSAGTGNLDQVGKVDLISGIAQRVFNFTNNSAQTIIELFNGKIYVSNVIGGAYHLIEVTPSTIPYPSFDRGDVGLGTNLISFAGNSIGGINYLAMTSSGGGLAGLKVWNLDTNLAKCSSVSFKGIYSALSSDNWYVTVDDGTIRVYNNSCALQSTIAAASLCGAGYVMQTIIINGANLFASCDNTGTLNSMTLYNITSGTKIITYACGYNSVIADSMVNMAYVSTFDVLACSMPDSNIVRILWQNLSGNPTQPQISDFCKIPGNEDLLTCFLEDKGGALGGNYTQNPVDIRTSSCNILIQIGFLTNTNCTTNGTGYFLLLIALIIANTMLWVGTHGDAFTRSNIFIPALISFAVIAAFTITSIVDPTMLIISVVALVALSAPKLVSILNRGGGSTE